MHGAMTHEQLLRAITALAHAALPRWGLEGAALRLISHSENSIFLVTPASGPKVVLRVHREGYHTVDGVRSELAWMRALESEGGVKTPQAIPGLDGADVQMVADPALPRPRMCVLFAFIAGDEPRQDGDLIEPFRQLGEVTARTHNHSERWVRPAYFQRLRWDFDHSLGPTPNWGPWTDGPGLSDDRRRLLQRLVDVVERRLRRFGQRPQRFGLIHADFRLANLLVFQGEIRVIDFDDSGLGWFLYDGGTAVSFFEHAPDVPALMAAWSEGYRRVRSLRGEEEHELATFIMLRRMTLLAWIGSHGDTDLAKQEGPAYMQGTCDLAERYLGQFS